MRYLLPTCSNRNHTPKLCARPGLVILARGGHLGIMLSILSILIGLSALLMAIPAIIPFLGWANWFIVPFALFGALIGQFATGTGARNFCLAVAAFAMLRLWVGGGII